MYNKLLDIASEARKNSYCVYSKFMVGAALLCENGEIFTGCNIENISYSLTNCAERTALFKAVSEGNKGFKAIAVVGAPENSDCMTEPCFPCGACLQVISEFCGPGFEIVLSENNKAKVFTLSELLPLNFKADLKK